MAPRNISKRQRIGTNEPELRGLLGGGESEALVDEPIPPVVGDEVDVVLRGIDQSTPYVAIVYLVLIDLRRPVLVMARDIAGVEGRGRRQLPAIPNHPLLHVALVPLRIDGPVGASALVAVVVKTVSNVPLRSRSYSSRCDAVLLPALPK
jgi:hypothetical protein